MKYIIIKTIDNKKTWKRYLFNIGGIKIFSVDGYYTRSNIYVDFVLGGHGYVYDFVPKDEIWIEQLENSKDMIFNLIHELYERYLMKKKDLSYEDAHEKAAKMEERLRHKYR